jgi:hypothetical protein
VPRLTPEYLKKIRSGRNRMALNHATFAGERDRLGRLVVDQFMRFDERLGPAVLVRFVPIVLQKSFCLTDHEFSGL